MNTALDDSVYVPLLDERIVVLGAEIDDDIANRVVAQEIMRITA